MVDEIEIRRLHVAHAVERREDRLLERGVLPGFHGRMQRTPFLEIPGQVVLVVGAVGRVDVHEEIGHPRIEHREPRAHLRRVGLRVVAIEIEVLRRGAKTHFVRAVLVDAVVRARVLVAVDVEDRQPDEDRVIEQLRVLAADREIAQQHQRRVLALDLAGVDAGLHEHDLLAGCARGFRRELAVLRRDDEHEVATFGRDAEARQVDRARRGRGEPFQIRARVGVRRRGAERGSFRGRDPVRGHGEGRFGSAGHGHAQGRGRATAGAETSSAIDDAGVEDAGW